MILPTCTVNTNNIQNLPDSPTLSSDELKQEFDKSGKDIKDYINDILLPAVEKLVRDEKANLETSINNKILADNKKKYRIGKIIMSTSNTNPNMYLGFGTWVLWGSGRVPVGINTNDTDFNTVEKTGGSKALQSHNHTGSTGIGKTEHIRVVNSAGGDIAHNHVCGYASDNYKDFRNGSSSWNGANHYHNFTTNNTGSGNAGNLQPYITCYMWKRTA